MSILKEYEDAILDAVSFNTGVKSVELVLTVMTKLNPCRFSEMEYHAALEKLIKEDKILEVEYCVPTLPERVKSLYFPAGTVIYYGRIQS